MSTSTNNVVVSQWFIKPKYEEEVSKYPYHLTPSGLSLLSLQYIQNGLLFSKPKQPYSITDLLQSLKESLSLNLVHFYPLAGQFTTWVDEHRNECLVFVDWNKGPGAKFIHATSHLTISDILSPTYVPPVVESFFDLNKVINHDGHTHPLLSIQVTELLDGIFVGVSMNHAVADGTSLLSFWHTWSETHRAANGKGQMFVASQAPIHNSFFPSGFHYGVPLPFTHPYEFIIRCEVPRLQERIFHFSAESIKRLIEEANRESDTIKISSLQALTALIWRSIVRASGLSYDQATNCGLAINNRNRLDPPLPQYYFPNSIDIIKPTTLVGELLEQSLGWAASLVHQAVANHNNKAVRESIKGWLESPLFYNLGMMSHSFTLMTYSPRFDFYGVEFGFGKPLAVRTRPSNKFAGNLAIFSGYEGGGIMDLEVYLPSDFMRALESDKEFMDAVSLPHNNTAARKQLSRTAKKLSKI